MRPHLGHVENVPSVIFRLFWLHDLYIDIPDWVISLLDGFKQVLDQEIGVFATYFGSLLLGEVLNPLRGFDVDFDVFEGSILLKI